MILNGGKSAGEREDRVEGSRDNFNLNFLKLKSTLCSSRLPPKFFLNIDYLSCAMCIVHVLYRVGCNIFIGLNKHRNKSGKLIKILVCTQTMLL
jgi:hypothetical protein